MSIQSILRYTYILTISLLAVFAAAPVFAQASADTTATDTTEAKVKKVDLAGHQLCIGIDAVRPFANLAQSDRFGYEFEADYYLHNEFYAAFEGGWGGSTVNYSDLKYTTKNDFFRLGFNKSLLTRDNPKDWDMMFMGMRLGFANVDRSSATFAVGDSLWGTKPGAASGQNFLAMWAELTGGMRVELFKGIIAGWNIRGKFLLNGKSFSSLSPLYVAGYGPGGKNTVFDFNLYISYGIRWKRAHMPVLPVKTPPQG